MTTILLAGATGLVGGQALRRLLADPRVTQVVAPTRRPLPPQPGLLNPIVESDSLPGAAAWWTVDGAICALGTTRAKAGSAAAFRAIDHDYALATATCVRRGGATRLALTSAMEADAQSRLLYPRTKGELEHAIGRLGFPSLTIVRPGLIGGDRAERRPLERIAGILLRLAGPVLPASARISPAPAIAALLVEAALNALPGRHVVDSAAIATA